MREVSPALVGEYLRELKVFKRVGNQVFVQTDTPASKPTKKLHLAALRKFFDRLVVRHAVVLNPAASVKAPKYAVQEGKTPALSVEQVRALLRTIDISHVVGLRDRAVMATLPVPGIGALIAVTAGLGAAESSSRSSAATAARQAVANRSALFSSAPIPPASSIASSDASSASSKLIPGVKGVCDFFAEAAYLRRSR